MKKFINIILILIITFSLYKLIAIEIDYAKTKKTYDKLQTYNPTNINIIKDYNSSDENNHDKIKKREEKLLDINKSYRLWIEVDGTNINYPVVQGWDNTYYLFHDFEKNKCSSGCIFIDYRNDLNKDKNLIIYGHNMKNNSMFQQLEKFKDKNFFNKNKYIYIKEGFKDFKYEIFSICILDNKDNYLITSFNNNNEYNEYLKAIKEHSLNYRNINMDCNDKIITLSTCSYEFKGARVVVYGKLINI